MKTPDKPWATASGPLTIESVMGTIEALKRRDAWEREHPHGVSPENPHIVSRITKERIERDGGYGLCSICGVVFRA